MAPPAEFLNNWKDKRLAPLKFPSLSPEDQFSSFEILDQLLLPSTFHYDVASSVLDAVHAIKTMRVRGAPLIATVGMLAIRCEIEGLSIQKEAFRPWLQGKLESLIASRPTAVNMRNACTELLVAVSSDGDSSLAETLIQAKKWIRLFVEREEEETRVLCWSGVERVARLPQKHPEGYTVMTICNTGTLATTSWGTAAGIIYGLHNTGRLRRAIALETRPYNQGSRLTASEFGHMGIPFTLVTDGMAAAAMEKFGVDVVIVGADRVVANGDTANKIGTHNVAIVAAHYSIPFIVALPMTTFDPFTPTGEEIVIEERPGDEMRYSHGQPNCPADTAVWNPAFDVTPSQLIHGYVTDEGFLMKEDLRGKVNNS